MTGSQGGTATVRVEFAHADCSRKEASIRIKATCPTFEKGHVIDVDLLKIRLTEAINESRPTKEGWCFYSTTDAKFEFTIPHPGPKTGMEKISIDLARLNQKRIGKPGKYHLTFEAQKSNDGIKYQKIGIGVIVRKDMEERPEEADVNQEVLVEINKQGPLTAGIVGFGLNIDKKNDKWTMGGWADIKAFLEEDFSLGNSLVLRAETTAEPKQKLQGVIRIELVDVRGLATAVQVHGAKAFTDHIKWDFHGVQNLQIDVLKDPVKDTPEDKIIKEGPYEGKVAAVSILGDLNPVGQLCLMAEIKQDFGPWDAGKFKATLLGTDHSDSSDSESNSEADSTSSDSDSESDDDADDDPKKMFVSLVYDLTEGNADIVSARLRIMITDMEGLDGELIFEGTRGDGKPRKGCDELTNYAKKKRAWAFSCILEDDSSLEAFGFDIKPFKKKDEETAIATLTATFTNDWDFEKITGTNLGVYRNTSFEEGMNHLLLQPLRPLLTTTKMLASRRSKSRSVISRCELEG